MIGAVVPVCNRRDNLVLLLESMQIQTDDDIVVVADDGSTDGTRDLVEDLAHSSVWGRRLRWIGCGPDLGVRTGRARNIGAANLPGDVELLVMLDSDLVLRPEAMALFRTAHREQPDTVLLGAVEWLPPLDRAVVHDAVIGQELPVLRTQVPTGAPIRVEGTFTGPELRTDLFRRRPDTAVALDPGWALPLNSGWPPALYWRAGGFDEAMQGYGYQDMEFGVRAAQAGATCVPCPQLWALHVWHPKPPRAMGENQRNLDLYLRRHRDFLRRHHTDDDLEADVDWRLWWHYHAEREGAAVRDDEQLWALSRDRRHRLVLPDPSWLPRLGHRLDAVTPASRNQLDQAADHGTAHD
ncbi:MAG: glycosyltransferase family 2 protein [Pseudonocardia sp.]